MSEQENAALDEMSDVRNQMVRRLAVAGVLVAVLLGVLAFFDHLSKTPDEPALPVFTEPVPVGPRKIQIQPAIPAAPETAPTPPVVAEPSTAEPPPPAPQAEPTSSPAAVEPPQKTPRAAAQATVTAPAKRPQVLPEPPPRPVIPAVPEVSAAPPIAPPEREQTQMQAPSARIVERTTVNPPPRLFSGFVLQAGVFASAERAEELHAKLALSGLPSSVETRVQVGPFKSRQEAERAQEKLRELGIQTILVPPKGKP